MKKKICLSCTAAKKSAWAELKWKIVFFSSVLFVFELKKKNAFEGKTRPRHSVNGKSHCVWEMFKWIAFRRIHARLMKFIRILFRITIYLCRRLWQFLLHSTYLLWHNFESISSLCVCAKSCEDFTLKHTVLLAISWGYIFVFIV